MPLGQRPSSSLRYIGVSTFPARPVWKRWKLLVSSCRYITAYGRRSFLAFLIFLAPMSQAVSSAVFHVWLQVIKPRFDIGTTSITTAFSSPSHFIGRMGQGFVNPTASIHNSYDWWFGKSSIMYYDVDTLWYYDYYLVLLCYILIINYHHQLSFITIIYYHMFMCLLLLLFVILC